MLGKLIIFTSSYPYGLTETFLHNEVLALAEEFDIELIPLMKHHEGETPQKLPDNVSYRAPLLPRSYSRRLLKGLFNFAPLWPFLKDLWNIRKSTHKKSALKRWTLSLITNRVRLSDKNIRAILQDRSDAIVYFYWGGFPIHLVKNLRPNSFIRVHGGELNFERQQQYIPLIQDKVINDKVTYLPISKDATEKIHHVNPQASCKLSRLGVEAKGTNPGNNDDGLTRIVSCSNVIGIKRVSWIVKALSQLPVQTKVKWVHFGDGVLWETLKKEARLLPAHITVKFPGRIPNEQVIDFYRKVPIDLFINVSETEGVPVSIMEALSFGIPCFATNVGGTHEILKASGGVLVDKDFDIKQLTECIVTIKERTRSKSLREGAYNLWKQRCNAADNYSALIHLFKNH